MIRRSIFVMSVFGAVFIVATGSAVGGMMGHFSTVPSGPAMNRGPIGDEGGKIDQPRGSREIVGSGEDGIRGPVETGNVPERPEQESGDAAAMGNKETPDRRDIDSGP